MNIKSFLMIFLVLLLLISGILVPFFWVAFFGVFIVCLSTSLLIRKIHQENHQIIGGFIRIEEAKYIQYSKFLDWPILISVHVFLLVSMVLMLRQCTIFWGSAIFSPDSRNLVDWTFYALDMLWKAVLFDIPEIYRLNLTHIEHVGFWGSTIVFFSRLIILALVVGSIIRWRTTYNVLMDIIGLSQNYPQIGESKLILFLQMYPEKLGLLCKIVKKQNIPANCKMVLLETMGKYGNPYVMPTLEEIFKKSHEQNLVLASLRGMEFLGKGRISILSPLLEDRQNGVLTPDELQLRQQACKTIRSWKGKESVEFLARVAEKHGNMQLRLRAIQCLGETKNPQAQGLLMGIMQNGNKSKEERFTAKDAMAQIQDVPDGIKGALKQELKNSPYVDNRRFAAMILGIIPNDEILSFLQTDILPQEKDADTKSYVIEGMGQICDSLIQGGHYTRYSSSILKSFALLKQTASSASETLLVRVSAIRALFKFSKLLEDNILKPAQFLEECLLPLSKDPDSHIADVAADIVGKIAPYTGIQEERRRDCITTRMPIIKP